VVGLLISADLRLLQLRQQLPGAARSLISHAWHAASVFLPSRASEQAHPDIAAARQD
jgi:hypothetical protein